MLIVLSLYFIVVWLVFFKFQFLPWNRAWKTTIYSIAAFVALVVIGALKYYTPVSNSAVVQADTQFVAPVVSGQVIDVAVRDSAEVSEGQVLFRLDPQPFQYRLDTARAELKLAEIQLQDMTVLVEREAAAVSRLDPLRAEVDIARAKLQQAEYDLEHAVVTAPADGTISMIALREGEVVDSGTPVMNFASDEPRLISAAFAQNGMERMAPGDRATLVFSSAPGAIYEAEVLRVSPTSVQGQLTPDNVEDPAEAILSTTGLYPVMIDFPGDAPDHVKRPGTEATITVFNEASNPINVLATIVQWISSKLAYL